MSLLLLPVAAPAIVSPLLLILPVKWRRVLLFLFLSGLFAAAISILMGADFESTTLLPSVFQSQTGLSVLSFAVHPYGKIAAFGFTLVGSLGLLYGLKLSSGAEQAVTVLAIGSAIGVSFADNFLTFLLFWELLSLTAAALVYLKKTPESVKMATRLLAFQLVGGFALTVGIVQQYYATGSLALAVPEAGVWFFILGIGIKTGFIPLHLWVPWGYPAASFPSSVLLAALCTKVGVYGVARLLPPGEGIALMGALMALVGVSFALIQGDLRRLLSYHIISQVGYMVAAVGLGLALSVDGGLLHLVNHMIYKALLFMSAGALIWTTGSGNIHELHHPSAADEGPPLWRIIPVAFIGALVGALSIAGMPPFNGYVSKYLIKHGTHDLALVYWVLIIASVGTSLSFAKFVYFGFIKGRLKIKRRLDIPMQAAIIGLASCCILFGVYPELLKPVLPYSSELHVYSLDGVLTGIGLVAGGILLFALLSRQLQKKIVTPQWIVLAGRQLSNAAVYSFFAVWNFATFLVAVFLRLCGTIFRFLFRGGFGLFQRLDYRPGDSKTFRVINFSNIDFDVMLVMFVFGVLLVALFYLQFG